MTEDDHSSRESSAVRVVSRLDSPIINPQKIAEIPKCAILSVKSCAIANAIPWAPYGHDAVLALSLALYSELLRESASRWYEYLQTLPVVHVPIARLWAHQDAFPQGDAAEAAQWILGTDISRELLDDDGAMLLDAINQYYASEVDPLLSSMNYRPSLRGFLHAYSLVCSRAFLVDAFHGLSMVPVADAFNHSHENHVQLASEYDVCPVCGSLLECLHDREDDSSLVGRTPSMPSAVDLTDTVDMVTIRSIAPGAEIFNTYGTSLGNAALLARYGFTSEGAETDTVTFGWPGSGLTVDSDSVEWRSAYNAMRQELEAMARDSVLVYMPDEESVGSRFLSINSDGQVSAGLFTWAVMESFRLNPPRDLQSRSHVFEVVLETVFEALGDCPHAKKNSGTHAEDDPLSEEFVYLTLVSAAGTLSELCRSRIARTGKDGHLGADRHVLGDILDSLPPAAVKTKLALGYLLGERAILEACAVGWDDVRDATQFQ